MAYTSPRDPSLASPKASSRDVGSHEIDNGEDSEEKNYLLYAQKLNNNAAMCIEIGYYEKATQSLQKALEFSQKQTDENLVEVCPCGGCKRDANIDFSADFAPPTGGANVGRARRRSMGYISDSDDEDVVCKRSLSKEEVNLLTKSISNPKVNKMSKEERNRLRDNDVNGKNASWSIRDEYCEHELDRYDDEDQEIYGRPIRVLREGHPMGGSLFLIVTFNLALTHHLEVATAYSKRRYDSKSAKKALLFYELTAAHEARLLSDKSNMWDSLSSIRFNTILNSNLNQLFEYLPEMSLPSARSLVSNILTVVEDETERLSGGSPYRSPRSGKKSLKNSNRWSNDGGSSMSMPPVSPSMRGSSPAQTKIPRSLMRPSSNRYQRRKSSGHISRSDKLQSALGDLAPATRRLSC
jgi:hypothetical protein